ncbi:MAG: hypothetical protein R3C09_18070 [Pirellulaceae bacterium]
MNENTVRENSLLPDNANGEAELWTMVVIDASGTRLAERLDSDTGLTLLGLMSEDPSSWEEALDYWPRYRSPVVCEFPSSLPLTLVDSATAFGALESRDQWIVFDLVQKRVLTAPAMSLIGRDPAYDMCAAGEDSPSCPLFIHLPPWWEMLEQVPVSAVCQPRSTPIDKPHVDRKVLYGDALLNDLAKRILAAVESSLWRTKKAATDERARYPFTVAVHRQWLMTGRPDLDGRKPRQLLHGAVDWIDRIIEGQQQRFNYTKQMIALPDSGADFDTAPMGREEMVFYFDLCRELIDAGWMWCIAQGDRHAQRGLESTLSVLVAFLREVEAMWMASPFEGGASPSFSIECCRRRVPQGVGVTIEGMSQAAPAEHVLDCDCPLCIMMAEGMFGVAFMGVDGHHLELDEEFAFSMCATREQWQEMQAEFVDESEFECGDDEECSPEEAMAPVGQSAQSISGDSEVVAHDKADAGLDSDEFASAWSGSAADEPLPGDADGHLQLAFLLAEIVGDLQRQSAPAADIKTLNAAFVDYRHRSPDEAVRVAERFKAALQFLAERYPSLVSKVADLHSRIDEQLRTPIRS